MTTGEILYAITLAIHVLLIVVLSLITACWGRKKWQDEEADTKMLIIMVILFASYILPLLGFGFILLL